jgi:hypothetical protein
MQLVSKVARFVAPQHSTKLSKNVRRQKPNGKKLKC